MTRSLPDDDLPAYLRVSFDDVNESNAAEVSASYRKRGRPPAHVRKARAILGDLPDLRVVPTEGGGTSSQDEDPGRPAAVAAMCDFEAVHRSVLEHQRHKAALEAATLGKGEQRSFLSEQVDRFGYTDDAGHRYLDLPDPVDDIWRVKRQRGVSRTLDEDTALALAQKHALVDRCVQMVPTVDQEAFEAAWKEGLIPERAYREAWVEREAWSLVLRPEDPSRIPGFFATEEGLEDELVAAFARLDWGAPLELLGRQHMTPVGPIDLFCRDTSTGAPVPVELKRGRSSDETVGQVLRYMGWAQEAVAPAGVQVQGIIVAPAVTMQLRFAVSVVPGLRVIGCRRGPDGQVILAGSGRW